MTAIGMLLMNNKRGKPSSKRSLSCAPSWVSIQNRETTQRNLKRDSCSLNHHHYLLFIIDSFLMFCCKLAKENWFWFCYLSILTNLVIIVISINVEAVHQLHDFNTGKNKDWVILLVESGRQYWYGLNLCTGNDL